MALNDDIVLTGNHKDDEMSPYKKCALNVVTFRIVYSKNDLDASHKKTNSFHPDMAHQIFGESEMIYGYKHLSVNLFYLHNSAKCYVEVDAREKVNPKERQEADDIMQALNPWLPVNFRTDKNDFMRDIEQENQNLMFGDLIHSFEIDNKKYKITICDTKNEEFKSFHQRFETFIVWFIDGANFIDLDDPRWTIFYVYEETVNPETEETCLSPIGFCTVYKFFLYPNGTRPRISQFFVLPTHQRKGIGSTLYSAVYNYLKDLPDSGDITVEEPTEVFQKIRDYCDSLEVYQDLEQNKINISTQNQKRIGEFLKRHKICKRQAQRVFDILECLISHKNGYEEYVKFTQSIRARIANEIEKETRGSKRRCNFERAPEVTNIDKDSIVEAEYKRYVDSLEWPTKRLMTQLSKISGK